MARPWVKVYVSMLDHPDVGRLSDAAFRRFVEMLLLAGRDDADGCIGTVSDVAWALRCPEGDVSAALDELDGRIEQRDGLCYVRDWAEWQPPTTSAQRSRRHRRNVAATSRERKRDALDIDKEQDKEREQEIEKTPAAKAAFREGFADELHEVTGWESRSGNGKLYSWAGKLCGTFGPPSGEDVIVAGDLFARFWEWARDAPYGSGKLADFLTTKNVADHAGKWARENAPRKVIDYGV